MTQNLNKLTIFFLLFCSVFYGQMQDYDYKIKINGVSNLWHTINIPDAVFSSVTSSLKDIRVYGISAENDTIEAAYILKSNIVSSIDNKIDFKLINSNQKNGTYFFTFKIPSKEALNHIKLNFEEQNFDWKVQLDASHNQQEWYSIHKGYRIVSIKNNQTSYNFSSITFKPIEYSYLRVGIKNNKKPTLKTAELHFKQQTKKNNINRDFVKYHLFKDKENKQTILSADFGKKIPINKLSINVTDKIDYYRSIQIEYLKDSIKTEKGWRYNYRTLTSGTLSSIENNTFVFKNTIAQKIRVTISNYDNEPLQINGLSAKGPKYQLTTRFTKPATYYLVYGNKLTNYPNYDITKLNIKIPDNTTALSLGRANKIIKKKAAITKPLFQDKKWLWAILSVIIIVLGWFSYQMLTKPLWTRSP